MCCVTYTSECLTVLLEYNISYVVVVVVVVNIYEGLSMCDEQLVGHWIGLYYATAVFLSLRDYTPFYSNNV